MPVEKFLPLLVPPGVFRNGTRYQALGRWYDSHLVRWFEGILAPIGGWVRIKNNLQADIALTGFPRGMHSWRGNDATSWLGVGTHSRLYALSDGALTNITPAGLAVVNVDGSYAGGDYGEGGYGNGLFGTGTGSNTLDEADVWQLDNFGDYLVGVLTGDGKIYVWDRNVVNLATQAAGSPTGCVGVVVTPERFLLALGADSNVRRVKWASQETTTSWAATALNSAGDFDLATRGRLLAGRAGRRQTLLWTDADLHAATYIGGTLIYAFEQLGESCGLIGPNAVAMQGGVAYWMSHGRFFTYDGAVTPIPSDVADYVFSDLNTSQRAKIQAVVNSQFDEVTWYYPSATQTGLENDRYVTYNYRSGHWMIGTLARAAGVDRGVFEYPILADSAGALYEHERGYDRPGAVTPYVESGPIEVADGDKLLRVQKLIPDEKTLGDVQATFYVSLFPNASETTFGPFSLAASTDVRFTARMVRMRLTQVISSGWRVGVLRLGVLPSGRR